MQGQKTDGESGLRLRDVLAALDPHVVSFGGGADDDAVSVTDLVIFDPADIDVVSAGTIVLGVGVQVDADGSALALTRVGKRGAAAMVFRTAQPLPPQIDQLGSEFGVVILSAPPDVRWGQVYSLLRTAMATSGAFERSAETGVAVGDLFGLADAIAATIGGPVTIEDPHWRVLAYSNLGYEVDQPRRDTILGRMPPALWQHRIDERGVRTALRSADDVVRFEWKPGEGLAPRLVAPVRAGDELLGSIWVAEAGAAFDAVSERELARAAKLATVHLLSHRASEDIKRRTRGAFVSELLEGRAPTRFSAGNLRTSGPMSVLVFGVRGDAPTSHDFNPERVLSVVSLHCESRHPDAMCALIDDRVWAVVPARRSNEREAMLDLARTIVDRIESLLRIRFCAAVGTTVREIAEIPRSRRAAEQALGVLTQRAGAPRIAHIDEVRAHAVLAELLEIISLNKELARGKLDALAQQDRERGASYLETLRTYLDAWGNINVAAKRLYVHPNTLRYRLRRLVEYSGLDLLDPDERLVTELQLRMYTGASVERHRVATESIP